MKNRYETISALSTTLARVREEDKPEVATDIWLSRKTFNRLLAEANVVRQSIDNFLELVFVGSTMKISLKSELWEEGSVKSIARIVKIMGINETIYESEASAKHCAIL